MSENIRIAEGGMLRRFGPVAKLKTAKQGGGSCLWIQKKDVTLGTKYVNENGVFRPADDGKYGFSQFTAAVTDSGSVTGKKQDGNTYKISKDGSGNLVERELPTSIKITTPPTVISYLNGASIDFSGLIVKAYDGNGNLWTKDGLVDGVVPTDQLIFPVQVAVYDPDAEAAGSYMTTGLDIGPLKGNVPCYKTVTGSKKWRHNSTEYTSSCHAECNPGVFTVFKVRRYDYIFFYAANDFGPGLLERWTDTLSGRVHEYTLEINVLYPWLDMIIGWSSFASAVFGPYESMDTLISEDLKFDTANGENEYTEMTETQRKNLAYTMLYGDYAGSTGGASVPVQWSRPDDKEILEDTFGINVTPG